MKVAQKTMKAAQIEKFGNDALHLNKDAEVPAPTAGKILVEVHAAGVNPIDWKMRNGLVKDRMPIHLPSTLGGDFAGVVMESNGSKFKKGDEVFGFAFPAAKGSGSFAEFALADANAVALRPKKLSEQEAAALPLVGTSAFEALVEIMNLKKGQRILINGASGGIGSMAIQIAKHLGAHVTALASDDGIAHVKKLGADEVIDYKKQPLNKLPNNFDAILDNVGGAVYQQSLALLKKGGIIVSMLEKPNEQIMQQKGIKAAYLLTQVTSERLEKLAKLVDQGAIKVNIEKVFPLEKANEALSYLEQKHANGKILIKIRG